MKVGSWIISVLIKFLCVKDVVWLLINYMNKQSEFVFKNTPLKYFFHSYNNFRLTERAIEIPIVRYYIDALKPKRVLEIGNVTKHYYDDFKDFKYKDTLDKYEIAYDVINQDIAEYSPKERYDFIYSISTFEHMDSDGGRNSEYKAPTTKGFSSIAFINMNKVIDFILAPGGTFVLTFPLAYCNAEIDAGFKKKEYQLFNANKVNYWLYYKKNELEWVEIDLEGYLNKKYKARYENVNFLCIMEIIK